MHVRELMIAILRQVVVRRTEGQAVDWETVFTRVEEARTEAMAQMTADPGVAASFVSAVNLLVDCVCERVEVGSLRDAVDRLDIADGWESWFAIGLLRRGSIVKLPLGDSSPTGWTAVKWINFLRYYAPQLGYLPYEKRRAEQLWADLKSNLIRLPLADLDLADSSGGSSTWVTDDSEGGRSLTQGDPRYDIYDALGLTWGPPNEKTRAVLISCPIPLRHVAARSLHCPTAVDGWGNLLFVPRQPQDRPWPNHGAATARPASDDISLPEAIHGPAKTSRLSVSLFPVEEFEVGDRVEEYGAEVMSRAIHRLRTAVV
jgi:hypothetical protein